MLKFRTWLEAGQSSPRFVGWNQGFSVFGAYYEYDGSNYLLNIQDDLTPNGCRFADEQGYGTFGTSEPEAGIEAAIYEQFNLDFGNEMREMLKHAEGFGGFLHLIYRKTGSEWNTFELGSHGEWQILADYLQDRGLERIPEILRGGELADPSTWRDLPPLQRSRINPSAKEFVINMITRMIFTPMLRNKWGGTWEDQKDGPRRRIRNQLVNTRLVGRVRERGVVWDVFASQENAASSWLLYTAPGKRSHTAYDPAHSLQRRISGDWVAAGRPTREDMEKAVDGGDGAA